MIEVTEYGVRAEEESRRLIRRAVAAALSRAGGAGQVTVMLTTAEEIQRLNRDFRNVDAVTDVLTFPAWEGEAILAPPDGYLGDIAICVERAAEQADSYGHALDRELAFLAVHGALHLMGYDHIQADEEARMRGMQREILNEMGLTR